MLAKTKGNKSMTENELLLAISNMLDKKLKDNFAPINNEIDNIHNEIGNIHNKIGNIHSEIGNIRNELHTLKVDLIENNVIPRLSNIESHYVLTAKRYVNSIELQDSMKDDIELLKEVVAEHSLKLQKIS